MWFPRDKGGNLIHGYRRHPIEPAPHLTYALNEALKEILEEGLQERFNRNALAGRAIRAGVRALGLELYPREEEYASNTITGVMNPDGISNSDILGLMRNKYGVIPGGGLEELHGKIIRLAHMSTTSNSMYIMHTLRALASTLKELGLPVKADEALSSAQEALSISKTGQVH
jgi:aspartate aminotransferase-like enzyme